MQCISYSSRQGKYLGIIIIEFIKISITAFRHFEAEFFVGDIVFFVVIKNLLQFFKGESIIYIS
jgi:hypothetical protein